MNNNNSNKIIKRENKLLMVNYVPVTLFKRNAHPFCLVIDVVDDADDDECTALLLDMATYFVVVVIIIIVATINVINY